MFRIFFILLLKKKKNCIFNYNNENKQIVIDTND